MRKSKQSGKTDKGRDNLLEPFPATQEPEPVAPAGTKAATELDRGPRLRTLRTTQLHDLLSNKMGASLDEVCAVFGWQPHSARAALSGLRKSGVEIVRNTSSPYGVADESNTRGSSRYKIDLSNGRAS